MKNKSFKARRRFNSGLRHVLGKTFALSGLLFALSVAPAFADELADVTRLLRAGQYAEALSKADAFLGKRPRDAQMRFLKGVILTEQNKSAEAITVFTKLTEDYPDLPEPYNNLAVLYAAAGQFEKARTALDTAIRTNPTYATAYENLGDVHAKLASQAYDKALQLDSGNAAAKSKLTLVRTLAGTMSSSSAPKTPAAPVVAPPATQVAQAVPVIAKPNPLPSTVAAAPKTVAPAASAPATPAPVVVAAAKPEAPKPETKPAPKPAANGDSERDEVLGVVHSWAKAWSAQDVKSYLSFYGSEFQTPNGLTHKAWAEERQSRIEGKGRISVKIESPHVALNGSMATVKFRQIYTSDRLKADSHKVLVLIKHGGKWQIKQERSGS